MNMKTDTHTTKHTEGSVLVLTVVISTVLFTLGIAVASILQKEVLRHIYSDRSAVALNVANAALECTLYNDFRRFLFNPLFSGNIRTRTAKFDCGSIYQVRSISDWSTRYVAESETINDRRTGEGRYTFAVIQLTASNLNTFSDPYGDISGIANVPCAHVTVEKKCVEKESGRRNCKNDIIESSIEVRGYFSCAQGNESSRDVVRRFKVFYD